MGKAELAGVINVTRLKGGYFSLTIDGVEFPWFTQEIVTRVEPRLDTPSITLRIPAERVEIIYET